MGDRDGTTTSRPVVPRWMLVTLVGFFVVYGATVVVMGEAAFLIPVVILAAIVLAYAFAHRLGNHADTSRRRAGVSLATRG